MKKIVSFVFNEFVNDIRVLKENVSFKNAGFIPVVVATHEKGLKEYECLNGVEINRLKVNFAKSLPVRLFAYWIRAIWRYKGEDIFHCNDLYALPIGVMIKILFNGKVKIIYDCHEYETDASIYKDKKIIRKIALFAERALIKYADAVITVSDGIAAEYQKLYGIPKPEVVMNCPNYKRYEKKDLFRKRFNIPPETKIILYQGEYRKERGLETIAEAFKSLPDDLNVAMVFLGYGEYCEVIKKCAVGCKKIFFHETVGIDVYMDYVCSADYGIHLMENTCLNHEYALPNKIFEYAMAGLPVIVSNLHEISRIVNRNGIGIVVKNNTSGDLINGIREILKSDKILIANNIEKFNKVYNWENQEKKLVDVYNSLRADGS